jgi:hypothetical protein
LDKLPQTRLQTPRVQPEPGLRSLLRRKCACGVSASGECEECKKNATLRRKSAGHEGAAGVPSIVHEVLQSPGQPLDASTQAFMRSRFGHDFSKVRVHADDRAGESADAVNALAYTVGWNVVFGEGRYEPRTERGRSLLAHELTHVTQSKSNPAGISDIAMSEDSSAEREADAAAAHIAHGSPPPGAVSLPGTRLSRKVTVDKPGDNILNPGGKGLVQTNAKTIENYLKIICSAGSVTVDPASGKTTIDKGFCTPAALPPGVAGPAGPSAAQTSATATGCGCICDLVNSPHQWTIRVDDASWPHTDFDDNDAANGKKAGGSGGTVTAPSPNSPKLWGAATAKGPEKDIDPWLVLGHELCGHGWLGDSGSHGPDDATPRGEGGHQLTVARENALRAEHGIDLRGTFKDPNCGESYWRDKAAPGAPNWSSFRSVCEAWRAKYNAAHGTAFKIVDKIP